MNDKKLIEKLEEIGGKGSVKVIQGADQFKAFLQSLDDADGGTRVKDLKKLDKKKGQ